jgi:hypothetical protein
MSGRFDADECLDGPVGCVGAVAEYPALSGSGLRYPRCERHYELYVERLSPRIEAINRRYPVMAPSDFDPLAAGESWDEDGW